MDLIVNIRIVMMWKNIVINGVLNVFGVIIFINYLM